MNIFSLFLANILVCVAVKIIRTYKFIAAVRAGEKLGGRGGVKV